MIVIRNRLPTPFLSDDKHSPWKQPSDIPMSASTAAAADSGATSSNDKAVGHKRDVPAKEVVTTAAATVAPRPAPVKPASPAKPSPRPKVDFAFLRQQVT